MAPRSIGACRAIATAMSGDKNAAEIIQSSVAERLTQKQVGEIGIAGSLTAQSGVTST
jgi:hypothetical protein